MPFERFARQSERSVGQWNGVGGVVANDQRPGVERALDCFEGRKSALRLFEIDMRASVHSLSFCLKVAAAVSSLHPAIVAPPSTTIVCPVVNDPAREAR